MNTNARLWSTLARALVRQQLEAFPAVALEAADGVSAEVFAAAVLQLALVDVWRRTSQSCVSGIFLDECVTFFCLFV